MAIFHGMNQMLQDDLRIYHYTYIFYSGIARVLQLTNIPTKLSGLIIASLNYCANTIIKMHN